MDLENAIRASLQITESGSVQEAIDKIERLGRELNKTDQEIEESTRLLRYYQEITKGATQAEDESVRSQVEATRVRAFYNESLRETSREQSALATTTVSTATATGNMHRVVLDASYAVQDFTSVLSGGGGLTRAIGSVQNNIPILLTRLGVGAGLAGTVSLVTVGLGAAIPLLMQFAGASNEAAEASKKLADEAAKLKGTLTNEQDQTKGLVDAVMKGRGGVVGQGIEQELFMRAQAQALAEEQRQAIEEGVVTNFASDFIDRDASGKLTGKWAQQVQDASNRLFTRLGTDPSARAEVVGMARAKPGLFPKGFADDLGSVEPDVQRQAREEDAALDAQEAERQVRKEQRLARGRELNKQEAEQRRKRERVERALERRTNEDVRDAEGEDAEKERQYREQVAQADQAAREARQDQAEKARQARDAARRADPSNQLREQQAALNDKVAAEAMRQGQREGANAAQIEAIAREASREVLFTGSDVARAVRLAIGHLKQQIMQHDAEQAAEIAGMGGDINGMMPMVPTQMRRTGW